MAPIEPSDPLARIAAATAEIAPSADLTDAVMARLGAPAGDPLSRIAEATRSIDAPADLTDAVMARLGAARRAATFSDGVARSGPVAVVLAAALAAAAAVTLFLSSAAEPDPAALLSADAVEVFE